MRSHFGLFNTSHRRSEQQSSYRRSQSSTGTATNSTQHPALSRTFDDPSFIPLANSDLYIDHDEDIQRTLTQLNRSLPQTGAGSSATRPREMRQGHDTLLNHPLSHDEPSHFHTQSHVAVPDALYCYQDTTLRPSAAGNEACPSSPRPTRTRHIFQTEGLSNIQQLPIDIIEGQIRMESTGAFGWVARIAMGFREIFRYGDISRPNTFTPSPSSVLCPTVEDFSIDMTASGRISKQQAIVFDHPSGLPFSFL
ncbi:uncharacterized protein N7483_007624 [Penicillium malachiteum]|uniref:uncharacterized protein n=1 Tax=Penicillium malachiteum TaxID=1324776 RepID=UPI00254764E0|nr:uncharacterized protein N7483_007624 [Penicillium malachiteum]KAJ5726267.1 hypothetical protein N7483_007624 [Penicillium malachiteum]